MSRRWNQIEVRFLIFCAIGFGTVVAAGAVFRLPSQLLYWSVTFTVPGAAIWSWVTRNFVWGSEEELPSERVQPPVV
jgi:hypothetical protein